MAADIQYQNRFSPSTFSSSSSSLSLLWEATIEIFCHQILYIRRIYPKETFCRTRFLGILCHVNRHRQVVEYISNNVRQIIIPSLVIGNQYNKINGNNSNSSSSNNTNNIQENNNDNNLNDNTKGRHNMYHTNGVTNANVANNAARRTSTISDEVSLEIFDQATLLVYEKYSLCFPSNRLNQQQGGRKGGTIDVEKNNINNNTNHRSKNNNVSNNSHNEYDENINGIPYHELERDMKELILSVLSLEGLERPTTTWQPTITFRLSLYVLPQPTTNAAAGGGTTTTAICAIEDNDNNVDTDNKHTIDNDNDNTAAVDMAESNKTMLEDALSTGLWHNPYRTIEPIDDDDDGGGGGNDDDDIVDDQQQQSRKRQKRIQHKQQQQQQQQQKRRLSMPLRREEEHRRPVCHLPIANCRFYFLFNNNKKLDLT